MPSGAKESATGTAAVPTVEMLNAAKNRTKVRLRNSVR